ncbi:quinone oxidoreductase [Nostoc sp. RF31YmG]|nr:quinone oxidoreductase [Nostoc sp. RF31YmG]
MKAIRIYQFGEPEVMQLLEIPDPVVGDHQVLVQVKAAGVNPLDTYLRAGAKIGDYNPTLPYTPGNDASGVVVAIGADVRRVNIGDRIYAQPLTGSYAELALCNESQVYPLPSNVSFAQGSAVNVSCRTAYYSLFTLGKATAGEIILIHGASGSVGSAAVQLALAAGLTVIGTASSDAGLQLIKDLGAHHVFNHHSADYLSQIAGVTGEQGINIILEMAANVNLAKDLGLMAKAGRIIVIGGQGQVSIDPVNIIGLGVSIIGVRLSLLDETTNAAIHQALHTSLEQGKLSPVVSQQIPLAQAPQAHREVNKSGTLGRICLIP